MEIALQLDTRQLEAWASQTVRQMTNALRSAVDRSARYARSETIPAIEADLNVPKARLRPAMPLVRASRSGGAIEADWDIGKSANTIRQAGMVALAKGKRGTVQVSTFATTGGGSASLTLNRTFVIAGPKGGQVVMVRTGPGKKNIKAIYAGSPSTDMAQADSVPREVWTDAAERSVSLLTAAAVQNALNGNGGASLSAFPAKTDAAR